MGVVEEGGKTRATGEEVKHGSVDEAEDQTGVKGRKWLDGLAFNSMG